MPTYQYACTACAERLEVFQRFTDEPLTECPSCGGALRKVFSPVGVVFKGSGFYKTDSRSSSSSSTTAAKPVEPAAATASGDSASSPSSTSSTSSTSSSSDGAAPSSTAAPKAAAS